MPVSAANNQGCNAAIKGKQKSDGEEEECYTIIMIDENEKRNKHRRKRI